MVSINKNTTLGALSAERPTTELDPFGYLFNRIKGFNLNRSPSQNRQFIELLRNIRDFNPDVSKAVDNILTLCNPGYTIKTYKYSQLGKDDPVLDKEGQRIVEDFGNRCFAEYSGAGNLQTGASNMYPGLDALINMIHLVSFSQGAFASELKLTDDLNDIEDIYPVDPLIVDFQRDENFVWRPGFEVKGVFNYLNPNLFKYIPKDPDVDKPNGRSPLMSTLDVVFFQQQVYRDLQAIAHQTNMPRLDVKIITELLNNAIAQGRPDLLGSGKEAERQAFLDGYISDIQTVIKNLKADDALVHYDSVEVAYESPKGTAIPINDLLSAIDKSIVSATKQLPILLGRNEGATTTHATVQWGVYILQMTSYQKISHTVVTWLLNTLLRVHGRNSYVVFEYNKHKTTDDFLTAQAKNMDFYTYQGMVNQGWISNDEAAIAMVGHNAIGEPIQPTGLNGQDGKQKFPPGGAPPRVQDVSGKTANS